jgi:hypothetical protein
MFQGPSSSKNDTEEDALLFGTTLDEIRGYQGLHWHQAFEW